MAGVEAQILGSMRSWMDHGNGTVAAIFTCNSSVAIRDEQRNCNPRYGSFLSVRDGPLCLSVMVSIDWCQAQCKVARSEYIRWQGKAATSECILCFFSFFCDSNSC
ncbi:Os03g0185300 [Oryza sativa Japonica Group]|uniref:Os03g0185300 protein n=1 Tax=Oryza sativa subsp. japonica TaxID=39947 RepID=Q0DUI0_ORYSJ|nr:hypothetical protein DAI22_03g066400 [Oryza sativa Japonica Group]BAF11108.1 Os03g0185300 [Oryza sativa Japonica Group]|eukprot:NP_001049194.1 Os03g0185300 [Oryza sativa Japonica Group]